MRFPILLLGALLIVTDQVSCFIDGRDPFVSLTRRRRTIEPILDRLHALNLGLAGLLGLKRQEPSKEATLPQDVNNVELKPSVLVLSPTIRHLYGHKQQQAPKQQQQQQQQQESKQQQKLKGIQQQQKPKNELRHQNQNSKDLQHFFAKVEEERGNSYTSSQPSIGSHSEEEMLKQPTTPAAYYAPVYTPPTQRYTTPSTRPPTTTTATRTTTTGTTTTLAPLRYHYSRLTSPLPSLPPASPLYRSQIHYPAQAPTIQTELQDIQVGLQQRSNQQGVDKDQVVIKEEERAGEGHKKPLLTWLQPPSVYPSGYPMVVHQNLHHFSEDLDKFTFQKEQNNIVNDQPITSSKRIPKEVSTNENPQQTYFTFNQPFTARSVSAKNEIGEMLVKGRRIDDLDVLLDQQIMDEVFAEEKTPREAEKAKSRLKYFQPAGAAASSSSSPPPPDQSHLSSNHQPTSSLWSLAQHFEEHF